MLPRRPRILLEKVERPTERAASVTASSAGQEESPQPSPASTHGGPEVPAPAPALLAPHELSGDDKVVYSLLLESGAEGLNATKMVELWPKPPEPMEFVPPTAGTVRSCIAVLLGAGLIKFTGRRVVTGRSRTGKPTKERVYVVGYDVEYIAKQRSKDQRSALQSAEYQRLMREVVELRTELVREREQRQAEASRTALQIAALEETLSKAIGWISIVDDECSACPGENHDRDFYAAALSDLEHNARALLAQG